MKLISDFLADNYDYVSYRFTSVDWKDEYLNSDETVIEHSIFAGCFAIIDGSIVSLDGDTYSESEEVLWFETWSNEDENIKSGLTVLVKATYSR